MVRKGTIAQIFSMALHHDNPEIYFIGYLDFDEIKEVNILDFLKISENFEKIPVSRIMYIKKENRILYSRQKH